MDPIPRYYGEKVDIAQIPHDDSKVYESLRRADTVGIFQVESRAQTASANCNDHRQLHCGEAEELRRALGSRRSADKMKALELKLRARDGRNGVGPAAQEEIVQSISSFALYGFPESHAASLTRYS